MIKRGAKVLFKELKVVRRAHDVLVGHEPTGSYLSVEENAVKIINYLRKHTIAETEKKFPKKDVLGFVQLMVEHGLVYKVGHRVVNSNAHIADIISIPPKQLHWTNNAVKQGIVLGVILVGLWLLFTNPSLIPKPGWFFYTGWYAVLIPTAFILYWCLQFLHELGHYTLLKETGLATGISLIHKWHFILPHANISNARLLPPRKRAHVYAGGVLVDLFMLSLGAILLSFNIWPQLVKIVMLFSFLDIIFQFVLVHRTDISTIVEQLTGSNDIVKSTWILLKHVCPFCRSELKLSDQEYEAAKEAMPLQLISFLLLFVGLFFYVIPILVFLMSTLVGNLLYAAELGASVLFVDSLMATLMITLFVSFYIVSSLREHHLGLKDWFTVGGIFMFITTNFFTVLLITMATLYFSSLAFVMITMFFLGLIFGSMFLSIMDGIHIEDSGIRNFIIPIYAAFTAFMLFIFTSWFAGYTGLMNVQAVHGVVYGVGMVLAMLI